MGKDADALSILLDQMLECNVACGGGFKPKKHLYEEDAIDWLYRNLPAIRYALNQIVEFIFSNGLTTGDEATDEKLDAFLYATNINGATNLSVLREAIEKSLVYGKNGLRWLGERDGIINVYAKNYGSLREENTEHYGFEQTLGYIVSMESQKIWETDLEELDIDIEEFQRRGILVDKDRKIIILSKDEFLSLRNNPTQEEGDSPLTYDLQRLKLLCAVYERLNYDVEYDGPGRIILRLKQGYAGKDGETSTTEVIKQTETAKAERVKKAKREVGAIGKEIKQSGSDQVILLSDIFEEKVDHLPRVTKATEFFKWLENDGVIISQIFGMPPTLLGLGRIAGNVSMEKIIDNAMLNSVVPMRERFATQFSGFLAEKLGVPKIYFNKYEMRQAVDENDKREKVVGMIEKLRKSGDVELADKFAQMLAEDLDGGNGQLKRLGLLHKMKNKFKGGSNA